MTVPVSSSEDSAAPADYSLAISAELAYSTGLQPEDYGVLIRLAMLGPIWDVNLRSIVLDLQESGWRMSIERFSGCLKRLKAAGYVQHAPEFSEATRRPVWTLRVSLTPSAAAIPLPQVSRADLVYAIRDRSTRHVKIGISVAPEKRLSSMRTASPTGMDLLWTGPGGRPMERYLHGRFAKRHVRGEWFDFTGCDAVEMIKSATSDFGGGQ